MLFVGVVVDGIRWNFGMDVEDQLPAGSVAGRLENMENTPLCCIGSKGNIDSVTVCRNVTSWRVRFRLFGACACLCTCMHTPKPTLPTPTNTNQIYLTKHAVQSDQISPFVGLQSAIVKFMLTTAWK